MLFCFCSQKYLVGVLESKTVVGELLSSLIEEENKNKMGRKIIQMNRIIILKH